MDELALTEAQMAILGRHVGGQGYIVTGTSARGVFVAPPQGPSELVLWEDVELRLRYAHRHPSATDDIRNDVADVLASLNMAVPPTQMRLFK